MKKTPWTAALALFVGGAAHAQVPPSVDPGGAAGGPPTVNPGGAPPQTGGGGGGGDTSPVTGDTTHEYLGGDDTVQTPDASQNGQRWAGNVPETHVVQSGDTLWDICAYYFNNPWAWPKIWSYNPSITNPHWIYPGDIVRLIPAGALPQATSTTVEPTEDTGPAPTARTSDGVELRQVAFVENDKLKFAGTIVGATEDKVMLSVDDEVFVDYPEGKPPQVGKTYAIYSPKEDVKDPSTHKKVGSYILVRGQLQITEVKKGKRARAVITDVTDVISRGDLVGPLRTQFKAVEPVTADRSLEGVIVAMLNQNDLIGEGQVVFVDLGAKDGLKVGNRFFVIRRGDAYDKAHHLPDRHYRDQDKEYPEDAIGRVLIVETSDHTAVGLVTDSDQEAVVGDHVVMRKGQ